MKIFEIAVLFVPPESKKDNADKPALIVPPVAIIAKDAAAAQIIAARKIPEEYTDRLEYVQVAVRPF